jgi:osmotically-inducible protein OsmY
MSLTPRVIAIGVALILCSSCEILRQPSERPNDDNITKSVKEALVEDRQMNLVRVDADTEHGVVYLTGEVDTALHKLRAHQLARNVKGVKDVVNKIRVHD